jgi:hypothetical protein
VATFDLLNPFGNIKYDPMDPNNRLSEFDPTNPKSLTPPQVSPALLTGVPLPTPPKTLAEIEAARVAPAPLENVDTGSRQLDYILRNQASPGSDPGFMPDSKTIDNVITSPIQGPPKSLMLTPEQIAEQEASRQNVSDRLPPDALKGKGGVDEATQPESLFSGLIAAQTAMDDATLANQRLLMEVGNSPEIKKDIARQLQASMTLEEMLDPNSPKYKEFAGKVKGVTDKIDESRKDLEEFQKNYQTDPDRYMKNMSATSLALNALAGFFDAKAQGAAIRAGLQPSVSATMQRLDKAIMQDISLQKEAYMRGEASKKNTINRYADNMALLKNERAAEIKTFTDYLSVAPMIMEQKKQALLRATVDGKPLITTDVTTTEKDEKGQPIVKQVGFEENNYKMVEADINRKRALLGIELAKSMIGPAMSMADRKAEQEMRQAEMDRTLKVGDHLLPGLNKEVVSDTNKAITSGMEVVDQVEEMLALRAGMSKYGARIPGYENKLKAVLKSKADKLKMTLSQSYGMGAWDNGTAELMAGIVGEPDASKMLESFDKATSLLKNTRESALKTMRTKIGQAVVGEGKGKFETNEDFRVFLGLPTYDNMTMEDFKKKYSL